MLSYIEADQPITETSITCRWVRSCEFSIDANVYHFSGNLGIQSLSIAWILHSLSERNIPRYLSVAMLNMFCAATLLFIGRLIVACRPEIHTENSLP